MPTDNLTENVSVHNLMIRGYYDHIKRAIVVPSVGSTLTLPTFSLTIPVDTAIAWFMGSAFDTIIFVLTVVKTAQRRDTDINMQGYRLADIILRDGKVHGIPYSIAGD